MTRRGISLLEMILALAILGGSMGILSQIAGTGVDAAREATDLAVARLLAQRKMSEILLDQFTTPVAMPEQPMEAFDSQSRTQYTFSVDVQPGTLDGLLSVRIIVKAINADGGQPIATATVDRWMIDPALQLAEMEAEELAAREEMAAGASSGSEFGI